MYFAWADPSLRRAGAFQNPPVRFHNHDQLNLCSLRMFEGVHPENLHGVKSSTAFPEVSSAHGWSTETLSHHFRSSHLESHITTFRSQAAISCVDRSELCHSICPTKSPQSADFRRLPFHAKSLAPGIAGSTNPAGSSLHKCASENNLPCVTKGTSAHPLVAYNFVLCGHYKSAEAKDGRNQRTKQLVHMAMGQNPIPSVNIPIPTKID